MWFIVGSMMLVYVSFSGFVKVGVVVNIGVSNSMGWLYVIFVGILESCVDFVICLS